VKFCKNPVTKNKFSEELKSGEEKTGMLKKAMLPSK